MNDKVRKNKRLNLLNGKLIEYKAYISYRLFGEFEGLSETPVDQKEAFKELICKAKLIKEFDDIDYDNLLQDLDFENIAIGILKSENPEYEYSKDIYKDFFDMLNSLKITIEETLKPYRDRFTEMFKPILQANQNFAKILQKNLGTFTIEWSKTINSILSDHKEYLDLKEQAGLIATKYDWFISFDFYTTSEFYKDLIRLDRINSDTKEIDRLFISWYNQENRNEIFYDIRSVNVMKDYDNILKQIETGYEKGLFYLIIPTIFTVIEGVIAKGFNHKGKMYVLIPILFDVDFLKICKFKIYELITFVYNKVINFFYFFYFIRSRKENWV